MALWKPFRDEVKRRLIPKSELKRAKRAARISALKQEAMESSWTSRQRLEQHIAELEKLEFEDDAPAYSGPDRRNKNG